MKNKITNVVFGLVIVFVFLFLAAAPASAAINSQINFQGKITNPDGTNIANGNYSIVFSLYNVASVGTAIWAETDSVTVTDGVFQVNLGASCPFLTANACNSSTPVDFNNSAIFLGIKVGADPEMTPRVSFTASPYAFNSDKVGGFTAAQLVQLTPAGQQTGSINVSGSITTAAAAFIQGAATIGSTTGNGQLKFLDGTVDGFSGVVQLAGAIGANQTYSLPTTGGTFCLTTNNCSYAAATGGSGYIQNQSGSQQTTSTFWISGSGRADTSFLTPSIDVAVAGTLSLGTGSNTSAVTISKAGATTTIAGALGVTQAATVTGLVTANGGLTVTGGAASINGSGTASTTIGNATGTFNLVSSGLNVTTAGAVSGVTTLAASSTVTGTVLNGTTALNTGAAAGTQRVDASGNLTNIGNLTTTGASTISTTGATGITIKPGSEAAAAFSLQNAAGVSFVAFNSSTSVLSVGPTTANASTLNVATGAAVQAVTIGSTNTTSSTAIQGGTTGSVSIGSVGASTLSSTTNIANTSDATGTQAVTIGSNANAANGVTLDAGNTGTIKIGNSTTAHTINIGAAGTAAGNAQSITIGSNTTTTASLLTLQGSTLSTTNGNAGVVIGGGFSNSDTNLVPFTLDSSTTLNEAANTCTATVNNGALYYNSNPGLNAIRTCVNGSWEDLISTAGAFFAFFGVVPDSGAVPGDIQALSTANTTGPCKIAWATVTTVSVSACTAYSGGRKVTVAASTITINTLTTTNIWAHICLSGTNNQPVLSAGAATETPNLASVSFPNATTPIVCLADIKGSATTANNIAAVYDTRVYTTTTKEFAYANAALPLGVMVKPGGAAFNQVALPGTTLTGNMRGVVVASNGAAYVSGGPNVIIATAGLSSVKSSAATPLATGMTLQNSTTVSGYAQATATANTTTYSNLGIPENSSTFTCTTTANCNGSFLTSLSIK